MDYLDNNKPDYILDAIESIQDKKNALPFLIKVFKTTNDVSLRNNIALVLRYFSEPSVVEDIVNVLKDEKINPNEKGTLLYALENYDYSQYVMLLFDFLANGNYETASSSYFMLEDIKHKITSEDKKRGIEIITKKIEDLNDRLNMLDSALDCLNNL